MSDDAPTLFSDATPAVIPATLGHAQIRSLQARSILTRASGFMAGYDYTLNPYSGCSFGCTYCYAAFFARDLARQDDWGRWVDVKANALDLLRRGRTDLRGKRIYMSSVTDPYQPIEKRLGLVREIVEFLAERQPVLVVQTRSPLVTRDIDLFKRFETVRVNMTVTTDSEEVRRAFEPHCPGNEQRLRAIAEVAAAGVPTSITLTPLLPVDDPDVFAASLRATGVERFVVQPFHAERGRFVRGTRDEALRLIACRGWTPDAYARAVAALRLALPHLDEGQEGFAPP